ncbi:glycoside hydrolase family 108 protein [Devosia rhizoryzae]|uniref:Glycoside hydrolase family 108 protein n=1 Tax=Devosia rhizoryzae TaxID=2774137 RepID=A0ABX7C1K0_9HYPH|nr:glycoside hydrolase family 108 protein [Devosia rhizoryzae]QQR37941.1 glycoside hydrolase family 108 protein [Devosia rhizoryzae]
MADRFETCLTEVLKHEGGYSDHPTDPGGATNMGITRKTLARWRQVSPWTALPKEEVRKLGRAEAGRIYRALYWEASGADRLPIGIDLAVFDYAVNSGPDRAIRALQAVLSVAADGVVGPVTLAAVRQADGKRTVNALCDGRLSFLRNLATFPTFGRGWTKRVAAVRAVALKAVRPITITKGEKTMDALSGYKTYIVAALMLLAGIAQIMGLEVPSLEGGSAGSLVLEALAIIFLRQGLKTDIGKV